MTRVRGSRRSVRWRVAVVGAALAAALAAPIGLSGPFPPAVETCLVEKLGAAAVAEINVTRPPTVAESAAVGACYSQAGSAGGEAAGAGPTGGTPQAQAGGAITPAVLACVEARLGAKVATAITTTRPPTAAEAKVVAACAAKMAAPAHAAQAKSKTGQATKTGGALSASVLACVKRRLGAKVATAITTTRPPTAAEAKVVGACAQKAGASGQTASAKSKAAQTGTKAQTARSAPAAGGCPSPAALVERALADDREHPIPTVAEIACNAKKAKRKPLAPVMVTTVPDPDGQDYAGADEHGVAGKAIHAIRTRIAKEGFPTDFGVHTPRQGLPPWENIIVDPEALRQALRLYQAVVLADKAAGKPAYFVFTLAGPGQWEASVGQTEAAFRAWVEKTVKPRIALVAKAAEEVKAEVLVVPFEMEPEAVLNTGKLRSLPDATRIELAQLLVSAGADAARPHFKGVLAAWRGWQFHSPTAELRAFHSVQMEQVRYDSYDLVLSTFFAVRSQGCTAAYAKEYMGIQLAKTLELAARDGVRWGIGELDIFNLMSLSTYGGCGVTDLRAEHDAVLQVVTDALLAARPRPALVVPYAGPAEWQTDAAFRKGLAKRLAAFAAALKKG